MTRTDTKALAAAIEKFEEEFPEFKWSICQDMYLFAHNKNQQVEAYARGYGVSSHAEAFELVSRSLRAERASNSIAANHAALMDAEYGPVRAVR